MEISGFLMPAASNTSIACSDTSTLSITCRMRKWIFLKIHQATMRSITATSEFFMGLPGLGQTLYSL